MCSFTSLITLDGSGSGVMWSLKLEGAGGPVENPRVRTGVHRTLSTTNRRGSKAGSSGGKRVANHGAIGTVNLQCFLPEVFFKNPKGLVITHPLSESCSPEVKSAIWL